MKNIVKDISLVQKYAKKMDGVFNLKELKQLTGEKVSVLFYRRMAALEKAGILSRFSRGFYITPDVKPQSLSARINANSYISLGTILAKKNMIGSIPSTTVYAVKTGRNRVYKGCGITLVYRGISPKYLFGYSEKNGVRYATAEKAWLDTLYLYESGRKFSFIINEDIDISRLKGSLIRQWLEKYDNPRFVSFVKRMLHDRC